MKCFPDKVELRYLQILEWLTLKIIVARTRMDAGEELCDFLASVNFPAKWDLKCEERWSVIPVKWHNHRTAEARDTGYTCSRIIIIILDMDGSWFWLTYYFSQLFWTSLSIILSHCVITYTKNGAFIRRDFQLTYFWSLWLIFTETIACKEEIFPQLLFS